MEAFENVRAPKLVATLSAVTEVVNAQLVSSASKPSGTHYFGALMSGLEGEDSTEHWPELLKLLSILLKGKGEQHDASSDDGSANVQAESKTLAWVPVSVLRSRFAQAMQVFASVLQRGTRLGPSVLKPLVLCIGSILAAQDPSRQFWTIPVNKRALMNLVELLVDERPKVRRASNDAICNILKDQKAYGGVSACHCVSEFCEAIIRDASMSASGDKSRDTTRSHDAKHEQAKRETMALQTASFVVRSCKFMTVLSLNKLLIAMSSINAGKAPVKSRETQYLVTKAMHDIICNPDAPIDPVTLDEVLRKILCPWNPKMEGDFAIAFTDLVADAISRISKVPFSGCDDEAQRKIAIDLMPEAIRILCSFFNSRSSQLLEQTANACARIIVNCVDERLVGETNQTVSASSAEKRISGPFERVVNSLESLMQPHKAHAWSHTLPLIAGFFRHLGVRGHPVTGPILHSAALLLDDHSSKEMAPTSVGPANAHTDKASRVTLESGSMRDQLRNVVGAAVESMGPALFLLNVPLGNPAAATSEEIDATMAMLERRLWVLPVLKQHVRRTRSQLACFHTVIVKLAILCESKAKSYEQMGGLPMEVTKSQGKLPGQQLADVMRTRSMQLWELFASFCACPTDIQTYFKTISSTLGYALRDRRYPVLQRNVCLGLSILIKRQYRAAHPEMEKDDLSSNSRTEEDETDDSGKFNDDILLGGDSGLRTLTIPAEEAKGNLAQIANYASRFLPLLFTQYELMHSLNIPDSSKNSTMDAMLSAATEYCKLGDEKFMNTIAMKLMTKLLKATTEGADNQDISLNCDALLGLSLAVVQSRQLSSSTLQMFFRTMRPLISGEGNSPIQKRAYKILVVLCKNHILHTVSDASEWSWIEELASLLQESLLFVSSTVKKYRLQCLAYIVRGLNPGEENCKAFIVRMISEVILCTKESNARTREAAFDVLVATARCMEKSGLLNEMLTVVIAGLAAKTSHMRSATVFALSRLLYEFTSASNDGLYDAKMGDLVLTICLLLHEKSREVVKAVIGFLKVVSVRFSKDALIPLLPTIVTGLMNWAGESKNRFRQRIKIILERLIRRLGYDAVSAHVPASDSKLMAHISKMNSRKERNRVQKKTDKLGDEASKLIEKHATHQRREDDGASYQELIMDSDEEEDDNRDEVILHEDEMLLRDDGDAPINLLEKNSAMHLVSNKSISRTNKKSMKKRGRDGISYTDDGRIVVPTIDGDSRVTNSNIMRDSNSLSSEVPKATVLTDDSAIHSRPQKKRRSGNEEMNGSRFKSSKAGGDVRRKGDQHLPFAYVQMGSNFLNRRQKRQNMSQLENFAGRSRKQSKKRNRKHRD